MSSPHVAGAVALLLQAHPDLSAQSVRDVLQNSADPHNWWGDPTAGFLDNVHRQGAGMLDIDDAILATTVVTPAKIATGESQAGPFTQTLTVSNFGAAAVTYTLSHLPALATGSIPLYLRSSTVLLLFPLARRPSLFQPAAAPP